MKYKNILIHGYNKNSSDMKVLKGFLDKLGYDNFLVNLPLTFKELEYCNFVFEGLVCDIVNNLDDGEKLNLIGHSTGGLIIRNFLTLSSYKKYINKCVLIATPNNGSELADIAGKMSKPLIKIYKTLKSLQSKEVEQMKLINNLKGVEVGAIAGSRNNLLLGHLLQDINDGRVTVKSVQFDGLKDFIVLPYGHKEIHYKFETAEIIDTFIKMGRFK